MKGTKISNYLGQIEILSPICNLETLRDGRGAIFSWVPDSPIKEFTLLYFYPNKIRGNHFHPEFVEYFMVIEGQLLLSTTDSITGQNLSHLIGPGFCFKTPVGTAHAIQAISDAVCLSLITKPWNECDNAIVHTQIL